MVLVEIFGLQIEASSGLPLVLLREVDEPHRILPIFIGGPEALAIARGLQGVTAERPLTHDLLVDLLERTGSRIDEVAVTELRDRTFIAELRLEGPTGHRVVSSRPSDAIALAVRVGAPVYASEDVLEEAGAVLQEGPFADEPEESIEETVEEFREFLEQLNPSDFQGSSSRVTSDEPDVDLDVPEDADDDRADSDRADSDRADLDRADADRADPDQAEPDQADAGQADVDRGRRSRAQHEEVRPAEGLHGETANGDVPEAGEPDDDDGNGSAATGA